MIPSILLVATLSPLVLAAPIPRRVNHNRTVVENLQAYGVGASEEAGGIVTGKSLMYSNCI
jgi:hypothetical protein